MKTILCCLTGILFLTISCSNTTEQQNKITEFHLINGLGREIVAEVYENVQGYFVAFGMRMQAGDSSRIFKDLIPAYTKPSNIFTIIRILESDSSTFISAITESDDYKWRSYDDAYGNVSSYYTIQ